MIVSYIIFKRMGNWSQTLVLDPFSVDISTTDLFRVPHISDLCLFIHWMEQPSLVPIRA